MRPRRISTLVVVAAMACACSDRVGEQETGPSQTQTGETGTSPTTETSASGDGDGEPVDLCPCSEDQICVADCQFGDFNPDSLGNYRCVEFGACVGVDPYNPECVTAACSSPYASLDQCGNATGSADLICANFWPQPCNEFEPGDCPPDEKCMFNLAEDGLSAPSYCQLVTGMGAPGEACSSDGFSYFGEDSCDATSLCWPGAVVTEPFEGTCHPYCTGSADDASCPDGMTCELLEGQFHLCI